MNEHLHGKDLRNWCLYISQTFMQKKIPILCLRPKSLSLSSLKAPATLIIPISPPDNTLTQSSKIQTSETFCLLFLNLQNYN